MPKYIAIIQHVCFMYLYVLYLYIFFIIYLLIYIFPVKSKRKMWQPKVFWPGDVALHLLPGFSDVYNCYNCFCEDSTCRDGLTTTCQFRLQDLTTCHCSSDGCDEFHMAWWQSGTLFSVCNCSSSSTGKLETTYQNHHNIP